MYDRKWMPLPIYSLQGALTAFSLGGYMVMTAEPSIFTVKIGVLKGRNNSGIAKGGML
jgi:hypothetical protein